MHYSKVYEVIVPNEGNDSTYSEKYYELENAHTMQYNRYSKVGVHIEYYPKGRLHRISYFE
ncbi:MAG: hypothetical protein V4613_04510 [Bacteroidota bacterium]